MQPKNTKNHLHLINDDMIVLRYGNNDSCPYHDSDIWNEFDENEFAPENV